MGVLAATAAAALGGRVRRAAGGNGGEVYGMRGERVAARVRPRDSGEPCCDDGERDGVKCGADVPNGAQGEHLAIPRRETREGGEAAVMACGEVEGKE
jgi:hypothetical protein